MEIFANIQYNSTVSFLSVPTVHIIAFNRKLRVRKRTVNFSLLNNQNIKYLDPLLDLAEFSTETVHVKTSDNAIFVGIRD